MKPIIIDTDIGDDIDDAYALAFALKSPEFGIKAILVNNGSNNDIRVRALIVHKILSIANRKDIPIIAGIKNKTAQWPLHLRRRAGQKNFLEQGDYKNKILSLEKNPDFITELVSKSKQKIIYVSLGTLTNASYLLKQFPEIEKNIEFVIMGGSIAKDYQGKQRVVAEWNIKSDPTAAQKIFQSANNITLVPLDSTWNLELKKSNIGKIKNSSSPLNQALAQLYAYWKKIHRTRNPILYDPFTLAILMDESLAKFKRLRINITQQGKTVVGKKSPNSRVAMSSNQEKFLKLFIHRLLAE